MTKDWREFIADSRAMIPHYDRSGLGAFANDEEMLVLMQADCLTFVYESDPYNIDMLQVRTIVGSMMDQLNMGGLSDDAWTRLKAEVLFWWSQEGDNIIGKMLRYVSDETIRDDHLASEVRRYRIIYTHPESIRYYEAGIWDEKFIKQLRDSGIDAAIASQAVKA